MDWLRGVDLNHRPLGYEPNELPGCSTPHFHRSVRLTGGQSFVTIHGPPGIAGGLRARRKLQHFDTVYDEDMA